MAPMHHAGQPDDGPDGADDPDPAALARWLLADPVLFEEVWHAARAGDPHAERVLADYRRARAHALACRRAWQQRRAQPEPPPGDGSGGRAPPD
jgi:hypothetical protein